MSTLNSQPAPAGDAPRLPPARVRTRSVVVPATPQPVAGAPASLEEPSYAIGYGRPPKHTQFQKGRSGNPKGRPKQAKGMKTITRETLTARVEVRTATGTKTMTRMEAVMHKTIELAMKGHPRALVQLMSLYTAAVPDPVSSDEIDAAVEDFTETDLAMLERLRLSFQSPGGPASPGDSGAAATAQAEAEAEVEVEVDNETEPQTGIAAANTPAASAVGVSGIDQAPDESSPSDDDFGSDWDREIS